MSLRLSLSSRISCKSCSMKDILLCCSSAADFSFWILEPSVGLSTLPRIVLRRRAVSSKIRSKRSSGTWSLAASMSSMTPVRDTSGWKGEDNL
ncbi:hypothetical protein EYF80_036446 [Liparis tanakae]|uniref:Uncharacterized protein n=1 Tax=Liparis tanakae TaxID=230148 RepID=A0A4Z2GJB7_9TELE|nr:hypothetical protein EYF80_036446 [Liparis tanakae]